MNKNIAKEIFHAAKKSINIWDVNIDNIVISKLIEAKTNSKYLIGYSDKVIRPFVLILPKISGYVMTYKVKNESNELMSFRINDEKLFIWTKIKDLKNTELNALLAYDDRYIKTKIRTYDDKGYINFGGLNVPEDNIECESFTVISIDFLLIKFQTNK